MSSPDPKRRRIATGIADVYAELEQWQTEEVLEEQKFELRSASNALVIKRLQHNVIKEKEQHARYEEKQTAKLAEIKSRLEEQQTAITSDLLPALTVNVVHTEKSIYEKRENN